MRILVAADFIFPDHEGGAGRMAWETAKGLRALGHEVRVWCLSEPGRRERETIEGVEVWRLSHPKFSRRVLDWIMFPRAVRGSLDRLLAKFEPDRVVTHFPLTAWLVQRHPKLRARPFLHFYYSAWGQEYRVDHGYGVRAAVGGVCRDRLEKSVLARSDSFAVLSAFTGNELAGRYGDISPKICKVPGGVDYDVFRVGRKAHARERLGLKGKPVLLTVRNLRRRMGLEMFLESAALLRKDYPQMQAVIVGIGPLEDELKRRAAELGLGDSVRWAGRVPDLELPFYYQAADVFVLPSRELESFGLVLVEALACGTPCVGTPVGGIPEILAPLNREWIAPEVSVPALATTIRRVLEQPVDSNALRDRVKSRYRWDLCAQILDRCVALTAPSQTSAAAATGRSSTSLPAALGGHIPPGVPDAVPGASADVQLKEACWLCGSREKYPAYAPPPAWPYKRCPQCGLVTQPSYGPEMSAQPSLDPKVIQSRLPLYRSLLDLIGCFKPPGSLLDVGCGAGDFLALARERGWVVEGLEVDPDACRLTEANKIHVFRGSLKEAAYPAEHFDVVTLWEVLDMMENPFGNLQEALRTTKPGGYLFLRMRNGPFHWWMKRLGGWLGWTLLQELSVLHRHGFSAGALNRALIQAGWTDVRILYPDLSAGDAYYQNLSTGEKRVSTWGKRLWTFVSRMTFVATGGRALITPTLLAVARKPHPRPRVLHLITRLDTGGSSENVVLSARGLMLRGYDVLAASGPSDYPSKEAAAGGFPFRELPSLVREVRPLKDLAALAEILRLFKEWRPDIIHTHSSKAGILGRKAARLYNRFCSASAKIIHTPHGHVFYGYFGSKKTAMFLWMERAAARITDRMVALTEGEKKESIERGVGREDQWAVIHSGVRSEAPSMNKSEAKQRLLSSIGIPAQALVIGTVARLEPVKGIGVLLDAAARVLQSNFTSNIHFIIVGGGPLESDLRQQAQKLEISGKVTFAGHQDDVLLWMQTMDIYVQPSLNEGMGKTLIHAQSLGIPVVASRVCGIPDVVWDGKTGILTPPGDPHALADAITRLLSDEWLRTRLGQGGIAWVSRMDDTGHPVFSVEAMVERLDRLYSSI